MQKVKLVGEISKFGSTWETECANIRDIFKLIECQTKGFKQHLINAAESGVGYEIKRGKDYLENEEELLLSLNEEDIIITEVPSGAKGVGKVLAAIAIVALIIINPANIFIAQGALTTVGMFAASLAVNLALTGITEMMAPGPETDSKQEEGYLFQGPSNNIQQGLPVPVCYGELLVGGAPISLSFKPEFTSYYGPSRGRGVVAYGIGGYYNPHNSFLNTGNIDVASPEETNEFEVAS